MKAPLLFITMLTSIGCSTSRDERPWRVQVASLPIREEPIGYSRPKGDVVYREPVEIVESEGSWRRIRIEGWVHESSLTQQSLVSKPMTSAEFETIVGEMVSHLTNGVGNTNDRPTKPSSVPLTRGTPPAGQSGCICQAMTSVLCWKSDGALNCY